MRADLIHDLLRPMDYILPIDARKITFVSIVRLAGYLKLTDRLIHHP